MKAPVSPPERTTPYPFPAAATTTTVEPGPRKSEEGDFKPRYVALPKQYERGHGRRNLISGVVLFGAAAVLFAWAVYLAGTGALLILGACLATALLLSVMARAQLFRQRNAGFVAWGGVCLLAVGLSIAHEGWRSVTTSRGATAAVTATPTPISAAMARTGSEAASVSKVPLLREAFPGSIAAPESGPAVHILRDTPVTIGAQQYLAKAGDFFPLLDVELTKVYFQVAENEVAVPVDSAEVAGDKGPAVDPAELRGASKSPAKSRGKISEEPAAEDSAGGFRPRSTVTVDQSQREAIRRYPDLGAPGSMANRAFVSAVKEQKLSGNTEFFKDPNWPVSIAELLAEKEGWRRADIDSAQPAANNRRPAVLDELPMDSVTSSAAESPGTSGSRRSR